MARTARPFAGGIRRSIGGRVAAVAMAMAATAAVALGMLQPAARAQQGAGQGPTPAPTFEVSEFGVVPRPTRIPVLVHQDSVQQELKLTDAQITEWQAVSKKQRQELRKRMVEARQKDGAAAKQAALDEALKGAEAAIRGVFQPQQWERLGQIQLQAQGPLAFNRPNNGALRALTDIGPPLAERLKLSDEQKRRIATIAREGDREIQKAASFPIPLDPKDKPTEEVIKKYVESPEFRAAYDKASRAGRETRTAVTARVEEVLTESQRVEYRKMLGAPFDLARLVDYDPKERGRIAVILVSEALGIRRPDGGVQQADPDFKTRVDRPAYASGPTHPRILFDEAHHNFHTASGRYKPFAELMYSDGYRIIPNKEIFSRDVLQSGEILVIANALGAERMGMEGAANPAFTDAECDAVRDWVKEGGSLLLITDHAPMGSAAQCLAKRFDVNLSTGAVGDPVNSEGGETSLVFSRQNHLLGDHPITRGRDDSERVNKVQTFTGTSLKGPEGSVPILKLSSTAVDHDFGDGKETSAAGRTQGVAFAFGKGRVVVMGEAAELSAQVIGTEKFGMNAPGIDNRQMALNILHWLSGLLEPREGALKKAG
jgi:hypothetical protein